ncbi:MAG: hypothetical protein NC434_10940 [Ruminococcus sp.]|nr:hypothetical protein [Ruminococcus sp.]
MLREAFEWIKENAAAHIEEIEGTKWTDKTLHKVENVRSIEKVDFITLTSLVEYLKSRVDVPNAFAEHVFISIISPEHISVYSEANAGNHDRRTQIADVRAMLPVVKIGQWVPQTEFCIMMRANFIDEIDNMNSADTDRDALIAVASNIVSGTISQYEDTGISQKATIKTGIQEADEKILPEKVALRPWRTFMEVEQPCSEFIFRAEDSKYEGVQLALHEADGGRWKMAAMMSIKKYLEDQLAGMSFITVTA